MAAVMTIADYVIEKAIKLHKPINNLKLQKVLFFLNVEYLIEKKKCLIPAYQFEKWSYGPVIKQIFRQYSSFGSETIKKIPDFNYIIEDNGHYICKTYQFKTTDLNCEIKAFIDNHIDLLIDRSETELTHKAQEDPQWKNKVCYHYNEYELIKYYSTHQFWRHNNIYLIKN